VLLPAIVNGAVSLEPATVLEDLSGEGVILVVDDEAFVRRTAKAALERYGYTVILAESGREGIEICRSKTTAISAVLLDMNMPEWAEKWLLNR